MDKKAARPSSPQEDEEKSMSMPASASRHNTQEDQAQTHQSFQPLGYFPGGGMTTSLPPGALEKAMDPPPDSPPSTPAASSISSVSRSSTLNSFSTDTTNYSQSSSAPDDTTSVFRSSSLPSLVSYPVDRKPLPKGTNIRVHYELHKALSEHRSVFSYPSGVSVPMEQFGLGRINRYPTWPDRQGEGRPAHKDQPSPLRHLSFPIEKSKSPTVLDDAQSFMLEGPEDPIVPEPSDMSGSFPENVTTSSTEMVFYNSVQQAMPPDEARFYDLHMGSAMFSPEHWVFGSLDSKHDGLYCESASGPSAEFLAQRRKKLSRDIPMSNFQFGKAAERAKKVASQHYTPDMQRPCSPGSTIFSVASTIVDSEGTVEPIEPGRNEQHTEGESRQDSRSSTPSPPTKAPGQINKCVAKLNQTIRNATNSLRIRKPSWSDSDDNTSLPHEHCSPASEEDHDVAYKELVEGITNLISKSSCIGNTEDRGVPVELYVHGLLEKILNHPMSPAPSQTLCLPIRTHPMHSNAAQGEAGEPDMHAPGQGGYGGSSGRNKRKSNEGPGHTRNRSYEDHDDAADGQEELRSQRPEKVKKLKTGESDGNLSCPFRKRNPARFNVREHGNCALNSFADYPLLKRHIKNFHQKAHGSISCIRCKKAFPDQDSLDDHLSLPPDKICSFIHSTGHEDPEDGITQEVDRALKARAKEANIHSWGRLWNRLFPDDNLNEIPGPDHEPPAELDELQNYYYSSDSVRDFLQNQTTDGVLGITEHGFLYIVEGIRHWRKKVSHKHTKQRHQRDECFVDTVRSVRDELLTRQCGFQVQEQDDPPNQWESSSIDDILSFQAGSEAYASQNSFLTNQGYDNTYGLDCPQVPANPALYFSSEGPPQHAAPHQEPTEYSYTTMVAQNASPCSATGGSADRSSRPSSQSRDSGDLTQATQDTQYTQEQDSAHQQYHAGDGGAFGCPLAPGDNPDEHPTTTITGLGSTDQIVYGAGDQHIHAVGVSRRL